MREFIASKGTLNTMFTNDLSRLIDHFSFEITDINFRKIHVLNHRIQENKDLINGVNAKIYHAHGEENLKPKKIAVSLYETNIRIPIKSRASPLTKSTTSSSHFLNYTFKRPCHLLSLKNFRKALAYSIVTPLKIREFEIIIFAPKGYKVVDYKASQSAKITKSSIRFKLDNLSSGTTFVCLIILAINTPFLSRILRNIIGFFIKFFVEELFKKLLNKPPQQ